MFHKRSQQLELLDLGPSYYSKAEYENCLYQLDRIGRFTGGNIATLKTFRKVAAPQTILDVGCGGGQFTLELAKQFPEAQIVGIDISSQAIEFAEERLQETSLKNVRFKIPPTSELSYLPNSFDIVTTTLVCHHMTDDQLIDFLKKSYQVATKFIIINDLHRHWLAYFGFALIAPTFFRNRLIFNDGLLSIKRAFKKKDWMNYLHAAAIPLERCSITWHWAFRWVVCIDKASTPSHLN